MKETIISECFGLQLTDESVNTTYRQSIIKLVLFSCDNSLSNINKYIFIEQTNLIGFLRITSKTYTRLGRIKLLLQFSKQSI